MHQLDAVRSPVPLMKTRNLGKLRWDWIALWTATICVFVFLVVPTFIVVPMALTPKNILEFPPQGFSLHSFVDFFSSSEWMASLLMSIEVAVIAVVISTIVGTLAAIALHGAKFRGRDLVIGLILLPIATPLIVLAIGFFGFFARLHLVATPLGIGLAHSLLAMPYVYLCVSASLSGLDLQLVRAVQSLGGGVWAIFRFAYLPVILPGIVGGMVFAFAVSFDEVIIAYFLQGPDATTLPVRIFLNLQYNLTPVVAAVSTLLLLVTLLLLGMQMVFLKRRSRISFLPVSFQMDTEG
ncbi:MAG: ABC transporter permease [Pusillimonas sp.]|nr:MAG: ABC transporter permease [Pusillimonas sp.]